MNSLKSENGPIQAKYLNEISQVHDFSEDVENHVKDLTRLVRSVSVHEQPVKEPQSPVGSPVKRLLSNNSDSIPEVEKISEESSLDILTDNSLQNAIVENIDDQEEEYIHSKEWREEPLHLFVLTEAGKPVFSRHGSEDKLSTLMGVLLALVSCVQDSRDEIRHIIAGDHVFVFEVKTPLVFVAICSSVRCKQHAKICLEYLYKAIVSVLTFSKLEKIYETQKNFDLRRLLTGTDKALDYLCSSFDTSAQFMLDAIKCLQFPSQLREVCGQALQQAKTNDLAFAILIAHEQVVNICRLKEHVLHPSDLHIILNLINSSTAFHTGESWTPICLPHFNPNGYLHAHISYLDEEYKICLLLLSADCDAFFSLSENRKKVVARLQRLNCLQTLMNSSTNSSYSVDCIGVPELVHFIYKAKTSSQFTSPSVPVPYNTSAGKFKLYRLYQSTYGLIHDSTNPRKLLYSVTSSETILGWSTTGFELYAVFGPLLPKHSAISVVNKLLRWIKSKNEDLFIVQPSFF